MDGETSDNTPSDMLDALRANPGWTAGERDRLLDRLVERFPADQLVDAVAVRLGDLSGGDAEVLLRLVEAHPRPELFRALVQGVEAQPDLSPERAWEALAVLEGAGWLGNHPALAERWNELNEWLDDAGSIEELVEQIEGEPEGVWLALQGFVAVEPDVRPEIVRGLARVPLGPGLTEFLRLLAYSHDGPTRDAALDALGADTADAASLQATWHDLAAHHPDAAVVALARGRIGEGDSPSTAGALRPRPRLVRSLVTSVDGRGRGTILLSGSHDGRRATAAFRCDVGQGVVDILGELEPESPWADAAFDEIAAGVERETVQGADDLARGLLAGSLLLSGPATPPSWRFWLEATAGPVRPGPFRSEFPGLRPDSLTAAESAERSRSVLDACPDWLDVSPLTYELAEEIELREGQTGPDPRRDVGAYRFLFEHRIKGELESYRRMLLWMAWFWLSTPDATLARPALELAAQLSDAQHVVPGHPFTVELMTRSLAAAQECLRRGVDPRRGPTRP